MFNFLKKLISTEETVDLAELYRNGAQIVDVRTQREFKSGHIKGSKNIPLQVLRDKLNTLQQHQPLIVCCASGARSGSAKKILTLEGFTNVHNGGGWQSLKTIIS